MCFILLKYKFCAKCFSILLDKLIKTLSSVGNLPPANERTFYFAAYL